MTDLRIRPAGVGDIESIVTMLREIHAQHLAWDAARWTTADPPQTSYATWIAELIQSPGDGVAFVAEVDGTVVGYVLAEVEAESTRHWSPRAVYVHDCFVLASHRQRGIARALMRSLFDWSAATHPALRLRLVTAAPNEPARKFFESLGFRSCAVEMIRE